MDKVLTQEELNEVAEGLKNIHSIQGAAKYLADRGWSPEQMTNVLQDEEGNFLSPERCKFLLENVTIEFTPDEIDFLQRMMSSYGSWREDEVADNKEIFIQLLGKLDSLTTR